MLQIRKYKRGKPVGQDSCSALDHGNTIWDNTDQWETNKIGRNSRTKLNQTMQSSVLANDWLQELYLHWEVLLGWGNLIWESGGHDHMAHEGGKVGVKTTKPSVAAQFQVHCVKQMLRVIGGSGGWGGQDGGGGGAVHLQMRGGR